jgi:hypothetical protein
VLPQKLKAQIVEAQNENVSFERQRAAVQQQVELTTRDGGLSCWPKSTLHPPCPLDNDVAVHIQVWPYAYCKQWYHCFDLIVTLCKHTYHPFCLVEGLKTSKNCIMCGQILYPNWWTNFGFRAQDDVM